MELIIITVLVGISIILIGISILILDKRIKEQKDTITFLKAEYESIDEDLSKAEKEIKHLYHLVKKPDQKENVKYDNDGNIDLIEIES